MPTNKKRPSVDEYFMKIAEDVKARSTCVRGNVGSVIVKDKQILATGYNGAPVGCKHCTPDSCMRNKLKVESGKNHELCRGTHAEQNAIIQAAKHGVSIKGGTIYCTLQPCSTCAKLIINSGIKRVVYKGSYNETLGLALLEEAGIQVDRLDEGKEFDNLKEELKEAPTLDTILTILGHKGQTIILNILYDNGEQRTVKRIFDKSKKSDWAEWSDKKVAEFNANLNELKITIVD